MSEFSSEFSNIDLAGRDRGIANPAAAVSQATCRNILPACCCSTRWKRRTERSFICFCRSSTRGACATISWTGRSIFQKRSSFLRPTRAENCTKIRKMRAAPRARPSSKRLQRTSIPQQRALFPARTLFALCFGQRRHVQQPARGFPFAHHFGGTDQKPRTHFFGVRHGVQDRRQRSFRHSVCGGRARGRAHRQEPRGFLSQSGAVRTVPPPPRTGRRRIAAERRL